jgi:hypothetical protein
LEIIEPSFGIVLLIGYNDFLAAKLGIHLRRTFGLAMLISIVPIYGVTGASALAAFPVSEVTKAAVTIPFIIVPAAFAYQEEIKELRRCGKKSLIKLRLYMPGKL